MRYSKDELAALRKAALKSESLVGRKIRGMSKGDSGIDITGSEYDPRVGRDRIMRMSGDRLKRLLEKQAHFRKASVGYYKGAMGTVVSRQAYRNYVNSVRTINRRASAEQHRYDDVFIKPMGMSAKERRAAMTPSHPVHGTEAYDGMKILKIHKPSQIVGDQGAKAIAQRNTQLTKEYENGEMIRKARGYMNGMMDVIGSEEARFLFNNLTDQQFWFIWAHTDFPNELALKYDAMQLQMRVLDGSNHLSYGMVDSAMERGEQSLNRAMEYYEYAKTLKI